MLCIFSLNNENAIFTGENVIWEFLFLSHFCTPYILFDILLFLLHLLITFTISKNSSLVNIPLSTSNLVRASCWTTWDMRSSSKEAICLGSRGVAIDTSVK